MSSPPSGKQGMATQAWEEKSRVGRTVSWNEYCMCIIQVCDVFELSGLVSTQTKGRCPKRIHLLVYLRQKLNGYSTTWVIYSYYIACIGKGLSWSSS